MDRFAPGWPGIPGRWTSSAKTGVGTALSRASHVWFTISHGIFNEIYYPRLDHAATRDFGMIVTDGRSFFSEEKRHASPAVSYAADGVPAFRIVNTCCQGRYRIEKEIVTDPHRDAVLQRTRFVPLAGTMEDYHLYALLSPHLDNCGGGNFAWVGDYKGTVAMFAERGPYALAMLCSTPWLRRSVGFVGSSDGWQDLMRHRQMTWDYNRAENGNVALTGELDLARAGGELVIALGFGRDFAEAAQAALASLQDGFDSAWSAYAAAWQEWQQGLKPPRAGDAARDLYRTSAAVIRTHEDKTFPGAMTASLSVPWGFSKGDEDLGGYHLTWPRDLAQGAGGMLALGAHRQVVNTLHYFQATQEADGHWAQNMWLDGTPYWNGIQMDETAMPVLLVDHARRECAIASDELRRLWPMVRKAAAYLVRNGPVTQEDRWETDPGYTPFTLGAEVAALLAAAELAELHGEREIAAYLRDIADTWNENIERWIYVTGTALARKLDIEGYYVRLHPPDDSADAGRVVSPDALALVRFGLRAPDDPRIENTVLAIDETLKFRSPCGPAWRRYAGDNYGEHHDGSPFDGTGIGRAWPLLTGERGHYELAAGHQDSARKMLRAMECFANDTGMMPEQIWDQASIPERELFFAKPSGSAMPLVWTHAEYVKLRRSLQEGRVFDMPPQTVERYQFRKTPARCAIWCFNHKIASMPRGKRLRIQTLAPAVIHWSTDGWQTAHDTKTRDSGLSVYFADLPSERLASGTKIAFTFYWTDAEHWENADFCVEVR